MHQPEYIWIFVDDKRFLGTLINYGAYWSTVRYIKDGMEYEVLIENNEWEPWEEYFYEQE